MSSPFDPDPLATRCLRDIEAAAGRYLRDGLDPAGVLSALAAVAVKTAQAEPGFKKLYLNRLADTLRGAAEITVADENWVQSTFACPNGAPDRHGASYFLTVTTKTGDRLRHKERHASLTAAVAAVAPYLKEPPEPSRWIGYFTIRDVHIARLYLDRATAGMHLREDIARIDIMSERGLLETETYGAAPAA